MRAVEYLLGLVLSYQRFSKFPLLDETADEVGAVARDAIFAEPSMRLTVERGSLFDLEVHVRRLHDVASEHLPYHNAITRKLPN